MTVVYISAQYVKICKAGETQFTLTCLDLSWGKRLCVWGLEACLFLKLWKGNFTQGYKDDNVVRK